MLKLFFRYLKEKWITFDEVYLSEFARLIDENIRIIGWFCGWVAWFVICFQLIDPRISEKNSIIFSYVFGWAYPIVTLGVYKIWRDYQDWLNDLSDAEREEIEQK